MRDARKGNGRRGRGLVRAWVEMMEERRMLASIYVDASVSDGAHDGSSWQNAYQDLQAGLAAAKSGDRILVASGTYKPTDGADRAATFQLKDGVEIDGGYAGDINRADPDARDLTLYETILSGDIGNNSDQTDNSYHVVTGSGTGPTAILDGITITRGYAGPNVPDIGGGLLSVSGSSTVRNCTFTRNSAYYGGAAAYDSGSSPTLIGCTFSYNAASSGGAICGDSGSSLTLINDVFTGNSGNGRGGGAISLNDASAATIIGSTFVENSVQSYGSAIFTNMGGALNITNSVFAGNVGRSVISGGSSLTIVNSTLVVDRSQALGSEGGTPLVLANSIVWGIDGAIGDSASVSYSIVQGGYAGVGNKNVDPKFVRNPAGPDGQLGTADDDYSDLRLQRTSPAIDAGDNTAVPAGVSTDLAGNSRCYDVVLVPDTGKGKVPIVDMGAYEATYPYERPIARPGGPYETTEGATVGLLGSATVAEGQTITTYQWDLNYDGASFQMDTSGATPVFSAAGIDGPGNRTIGLRVRDSAGIYSDVATAVVSVVNVAPVARIDWVGGFMAAGEAMSAGGSASDGCAADAVTLSWSVADANGQVVAMGSGANLSFTPGAAGMYRITLSAADDDGGVGVASTDVVVGERRMSISGLIYNDANGDGVRNALERPIVGQGVYLDVDEDGVQDAGEPVAVTDAAGVYRFDGLTPRSYRVRPAVAAGWRVTGAAIAYAAGGLGAGKDFAVGDIPLTQTVRVEGSVFLDANGNRRRDAKEKGQRGVRVFLDRNNNGRLDRGELAVKTNVQGAFVFAAAPAGRYTLRVLLPKGYGQTAPKKPFALKLAAGWVIAGRVMGIRKG